MDETKLIEELHEITKTYSLATEIKCKFFNIKGVEIVECLDSNSQVPVCQLVQRFDQGVQDCKQSCVYGGLQAEKLGEPYIYYCPYGLVNWTVPILEDDELKYFLTGGPVLMRPANDLLVEDIIKQNPQLKFQINNLKTALDKVEVIDPTRVRYLSKLLMQLAERAMINQNVAPLERRRKFNSANAQIAETIHRLKEETNSQNNGAHFFEKESELLKKVKSGNRRGARRVLNEILGLIYFHSNQEFQIVKAKAIELMVVLARSVIEVGADLEIIFGLEYMYLERISKINSLDELSEWLSKVLDRFIECTFAIKNIKNKDIIYKAMDYIWNNYNQDISLEEVANEVGLSTSYFSKLFKEELDITYSEYLNKVKIEEGKKLLQDGLSLANVAQAVGFNDQSYFSRIFKRYEGISPGKWRVTS